MSEVAEETNGKTEFQIFGAIDRDVNGKVKSTYPSWYFEHQKELLKEDIALGEFQLRDGYIAQSEVHLAQERLNKQRQKLQELEKATPNLKAKDRDSVAKVHSGLSEKIKEAMYSRSDMRRGLADAHEEARRTLDPCIKLSHEEAQMARACNVTVKNGMVSRGGAEKTWKIMGKLLGDVSTNVESLRKD